MDVAVMGTGVFFAVLLSVAGIIGLHFEKREEVRLGLIVLFALLVAGVLALLGAKKSEVMIGTIG